MKLSHTVSHLPRGKSRRFKCYTLICAMIVAILLAIVVPLAVILPRNSAVTKGVKSTVLVPLYIYPAPGAWDPLYEV
jgi:hypothetical protein